MVVPPQALAALLLLASPALSAAWRAAEVAAMMLSHPSVRS